MARLLVLAASAPLLLIGAAYPEMKPAGDYNYDPAPVAESPVTYRPCRPGPGDDRCIQLYERGVRASYARWLRARGPGERPTRVAMGGPVEPRAHSQRRHREARHDDRCHYGDEARGM